MQTNANGLHIEQTTSLETALKQNPSITVFNDNVYKDFVFIGMQGGKHKIYKNIIEPKAINPRDVLSKLLLPDEAIQIKDTVYIIKKKFQAGAGSVDEKIQTCDFKKKQYTKLLSTVNLKVEYDYVLSDWFKQPCYKDVHDYILSVGCRYFFNDIPLVELGL